MSGLCRRVICVHLTLCLPWGQFDPNCIFEKFLFLNRYQQRYETSWLLFYIEEDC